MPTEREREIFLSIRNNVDSTIAAYMGDPRYHNSPEYTRVRSEIHTKALEHFDMGHDVTNAYIYAVRQHAFVRRMDRTHRESMVYAVQMRAWCEMRPYAPPALDLSSVLTPRPKTPRKRRFFFF